MAKQEFATIFNRYDSRLPGNSYTGYTTGYDVAFNGRVARVRTGIDCKTGAYALEEFSEGFDASDIRDGENQFPDLLPSCAQRVLGIFTKVPAGKILVVQWSAGDQYPMTSSGFKIYTSGQEVTPSELREESLLEDGQSMGFLRRSAGYKPNECVSVKNSGGRAVETDGAKNEKKAFAKEQVQLLQQRLGCDENHAWTILKSGGPGAVQPALEWLEKALERPMALGHNRTAAASLLRKLLMGVKPEEVNPLKADLQLGHIHRDAICVLRGNWEFGKDRFGAALQDLGLPTPRHHNAGSLFSVWAVAKAIVENGFFPKQVETKQVA